ncbi:MAG: aminopeptidase P family N-terminal domain-containing protein [Rhizobiales bacterium]|nr:aminopeptidase P family N-terminal domain-containing protein [Hyphomicrobiales bacterium]MBI3674961.1 aminopeptidase P family N-terminal domain-containing protein [Hyphomicrobiales bacterium]
MRQARLAVIDLPDFGSPKTEPRLGRDIYAARLDRLNRRIAAAGLDALVIYGDREHLGNICWATGYDPRFEEAILVVVPGTTPQLFAGNEGYPYAETAAGLFDRVLWQPLSLMGQPRDKYRPLPELLARAGLAKGMRIGLAGWKGFESEDGRFDPDWFETPAYLVEALKALGPTTNAALLFMSPADGLRAINEVEQLACFEYAAALSSSAIGRVIRGTKPGMSEYDAVALMRLNGFPQSVHVNMCAGPRAKYGLPSPSSRAIEAGDPIVVGLGLMGALNCRAGFMVRDASELPEPIADYVEKLVAPYFTAAAAWYETLGIGVTGGELYDAVMSRLDDPFFGVGLNPGHLIHLDEWLHSPVTRGGTIALVSGMALQCDIIPATGTAWFTSNIEDGVALLDAAGRDKFAALYPEAWSRIQARRSFMIEKLGVRLRPEVLPFSNIPAWLPPFWLGSGKAMTMA